MTGLISLLAESAGGRACPHAVIALEVEESEAPAAPRATLPTLSEYQLEEARELLAHVRQRLRDLSGGDEGLLFAFRRKVAKELGYDERSKPAKRRRLKKKLWGLQAGLCAECGGPMEMKFSVLDRAVATRGYVVENVDLIHQQCDRDRQSRNKFQ